MQSSGQQQSASSSPRPSGSRRGSVLIFVVAILVLLALTGVAYVATSGMDRTTTRQHEYNNQADIALESVVELVRSRILANARVNGPGVDQYDMLSDSLNVNAKPFLASRVPTPFNPTNTTITGPTVDNTNTGLLFGTTIVPVKAGANPVVWSFITPPLSGGRFVDVFSGSAFYKRSDVIPGFVKQNGSSKLYPGLCFDLNSDGDNNPGTSASNPKLFGITGADADYDGVADSGLVPLDTGSPNGISYFYAVRVVDLNSAINVNTALAANRPGATGNAHLPAFTAFYNLYPSNVDLLTGVTGTKGTGGTQETQLNNLIEFHVNYFNPGNPAATVTAERTPFDDNKVQRNDFTFQTVQEAHWMGLGRRIDNPGQLTANSSYKAFGYADSAALASGFAIRDPYMATTQVENILSTSLVTGYAGYAVPTAPYGATEAFDWYNFNFNYVPASTAAPVDNPMPMRALLTANNPVGNDAIANTLYQAVSDPTINNWVVNTAYNFGDIVTLAFSNDVKRKYVCLESHTATAPLSPATLAGHRYWALLSWNIEPQRIDVNMADFGELWWGFRRIFSAVPDAANAAFKDTVTRVATAPYISATNALTGQRMFRNPIRDSYSFGPTPNQGRYMKASEMLQLRAALAAVNAMGLRDGTDNVIARRFVTYDYTSPNAPTSQHEVTVYSTERQPYITEVYVNNDDVSAAGDGAGFGVNPKGYVAIELFNPYPVPMVLEGWSLGRIKRPDTSTTPATGPAASLTIQPVTTNRFDNTMVIPPNGFLVLENYDNSGTATNVNKAKHRPAEMHLETPPATPPTGWTAATAATAYQPTTPPAAGTTYFAYVDTLEQVIQDPNVATATPADPGGELVLMRPRIWSMPDRPLPATGLYYQVTQRPTDPEDPCDEGAPLANSSTRPPTPEVLTPYLMAEQVPVDSYDFTGIALAVQPPPATGPAYSAWHYCRDKQDDTNNQSWRWVQSMQSQTSTNPLVLESSAPTAGATDKQDFDAATGSPITTNFGIRNTGTYVLPYGSLQIQNTDWPNPNRPTGAAGNSGPFGAFVRETDLLEVPFIGSYRIRSLYAGVQGVTTPDQVTGLTTNSLSLNEFTEMNTLSTDVIFADDEDTNNDTYEQLGRFCPLSTLQPTNFLQWTPKATLTGYSGNVDFYDFSTAIYTAAGQYQQVCPHGLLDLFTTHSPSMDTSPGPGHDSYAVPASYDTGLEPMSVNNSNATIAPGVTYAYVGGYSGTTLTIKSGTTAPAANNIVLGTADLYKKTVVEVLTGNARGNYALVSASTGTNLTLSNALGAVVPGDLVRVLGTPEETAGTHGVININTAPWFVLARLPMVLDPTTGQPDAAANDRLAREIVLWRDGSTALGMAAHGPFRSIIELNRVVDNSNIPLFQVPSGNVADLTSAPDQYKNINGDLSPGGGSDFVVGDFEARYNTLGRIANMVTTRSDAFVVYIDVQGWRNANTAKAEMVVERRAALIVDRSGYTLQSKSLNTTRVPVRSNP